MSEEEIAKRIDANLLDTDIHVLEKMPLAMYENKISNLKKTCRGKLIIKEYPTAAANVTHFRNLMEELKIKKKFKPDIIIVAYAQLKDYKNAEKYYTLAKSLGAQNNVNLGNLKVRTGDYAAAASYYGSANSCSYNAALAATLAGNYDAAKKNADCATQDADAFYLKAIIGARTNNLDMLTTNLTRAIRENASLREVAKKDLEFKKYMDTDLFKVAIR
jgi:tetratricopeptide (TPR) repeat protein